MGLVGLRGWGGSNRAETASRAPCLRQGGKTACRPRHHSFNCLLDRHFNQLSHGAHLPSAVGCPPTHLTLCLPSPPMPHTAAPGLAYSSPQILLYLPLGAPSLLTDPGPWHREPNTFPTSTSWILRPQPLQAHAAPFPFPWQSPDSCPPSPHCPEVTASVSALCLAANTSTLRVPVTSPACPAHP